MEYQWKIGSRYSVNGHRSLDPPVGVDRLEMFRRTERTTADWGSAAKVFYSRTMANENIRQTSEYPLTDKSIKNYAMGTKGYSVSYTGTSPRVVL